MSKILPYNGTNDRNDDLFVENVSEKNVYIHENRFSGEEDDICPRYRKWIRRISGSQANETINYYRQNKAHHHHKHRQHHRPIRHRPAFKETSTKHIRRHSRRRRSHSKPNNCDNGSISSQRRSSLTKPLRSRSMFARIKQKGRNFGIRCKTSVELWKKWIKRGSNIDTTFDSEASSSSNSTILNLETPNNAQQKRRGFSFLKKSIINEVIPEEDEEEEERMINKSKSTTKDPIKQTSSAMKSSFTVTKLNEKSDHLGTENGESTRDREQKASNLMWNVLTKARLTKSHSNISKSFSDETASTSRNEFNDRDENVDDLDRIETFTQNSQTIENADESVDYYSSEERDKRGESSTSTKNSIQSKKIITRAFRKLLFLF
ncbi:hypothetical protein NH340_JMT00310 [Sarcoptes scabiei]|nr:hypothetical protein NH340_JMT00310 [Sarcoptes scabiei]